MLKITGKQISQSAIYEAILIDGSEQSKRECFNYWDIPIDSWFIHQTENSISIEFMSKNEHKWEYDLIGRGNIGYLINANSYYSSIYPYIDIFFFVDKEYFEKEYRVITSLEILPCNWDILDKLIIKHGLFLDDTEKYYDLMVDYLCQIKKISE